MAYIGNFPTDPGFTTVGFKMNNIVKKTQTASGRMTRVSVGTTIWSGTLVFPPMTLAEFKPVQGFVALAQGSLNEFDIVIPTVSSSTSINAPFVVLDTFGTHSKGDTAIEIDSDLGGEGNVLKAGDVVRFDNHSKVYMCTTDVNTDGGGGATLNISPPLLEDLPADTDITIIDVPFRMILSNEVQEFGYRTDGLVEYEIDVREVI